MSCGNRLCCDKNKRAVKIKYFAVYTLLFAVTALIVNLVFIRDGVTYVRSVDGYSQHIIALEYYGQWLRDFFSTLFTEHRFELKNFDFSIGMGSDVVTTLNYYAIGDPLNLFSVFVPKEYTAYLYTALTVLRMYLAGTAFSLYCFVRKHKNTCGILAGALLYAFSVFSVMAGPMHPFFINGMIYLPLIFISIEKIFENKNPVYLALIVCVAEVSNFYFFYMLVIATVVYVLLRLFSLYRLEIKKMLAPLMKIALSSVSGVLMGAVIFYPVVISFLSDGRTAVEHTYPLFYNLKYYFDLFLSFVYYNGYEPWTLVGSGVLFLYAIVALFAKGKSNTSLKIALLICFAGLMFPAFGGFSNGFSYASNRWCFIFTFVIAFACSHLWEDILFCENRVKKLIIAVLPAVYAGLSLYVPYGNRQRIKFALVFFAVMSLIVVLAMFVPKKSKLKKLAEVAVVALNICCIGLNSFFALGEVTTYHYSQQEINAAVPSEHIAVEKQKELAGDNDFSRYTSNKLEYNGAVRTGGFATHYYWSLSDGNISDFQDSVYLNEGFYQFYNGFDDIAVFNTLSSVKYYYDKADKEGAVPYGFEQTATENLYVNSYALPLLYAYDGYITRDEYDSLASSPEKQQAMLESAVLEEAVTVEKEKITTDVAEPEFEITPDSEFITREGNTFTVTKNNATVTLSVKNSVGGEAYLSLRDINFKATKPTELYSENTEADPLGLFGEGNIQQSGYASFAELKKKEWKQWMAPEHIDFKTVPSDRNGVGEKRMLKFYTPEYRFYSGKKDCDFYIGYSENGFDKIVLTFPKTGVYTFGEMKLLVQNMDFYTEGIEKLTDGLDAEVRVDTDSITADVSLNESRLLCFSIPYSEGWTAYIDGEEKELLKANVMYMAVEAPEGEHKIELRYSTPDIKIGVILSLCGFILLFAIEILYYIKKKNKSF